MNHQPPDDAGSSSPPPRLLLLGYLVTLVLTVIGFLVVRHFGETLEAPAAGESVSLARTVQSQSASVLIHVLLALAAVITSGWLLGRLFAFIHQPPVIGEVVAGIVLGPSLLGHPHILPAVSNFILPPDVAPFLGVLAQLGVILYMFLVGLELDTKLLRSRAHAAIMTSHASIVAPFLLGAVLALLLYPRLSNNHVPFTSFALFLGVAMSITAFPVLARILTDRKMQSSPLGVVALTCAAVDDVTAWCLLAFVIGVAQENLQGAVLVLVLTALYVTAMLALVRPLLQRWVQRYEKRPFLMRDMALLLILVLLSALATEAIGIHALFGGFLLGAIIPHQSKVATEVRRRLEDLVSSLLLPAFFAFTGMRTQIGLIEGAEAWLFCGLIIVVATAGKFGGTLIAARWTGLPWRASASLGILMNTRGLMELIVLHIGLSMGVISPTLFAMMVLMALATTLTTTPILHLLQLRAEPLPAEPTSEPPRIATASSGV